MGVSSRTLEITVISGENVNVKEEAYVVVRAESLKCCTTKMVKDTTSNSGLCAKDNNSNDNGSSSLLSWNEKLLLETPLHARSITFEVQSKNSKGNGRPIGVARIAISEILGGGDGGGCCVHDDNEDSLHVLSYRLRDWDGRRNGVIHFAVKVVAATAMAKESGAKPVVKESSGHKKHSPCNHHKKKSSEVVLGVPLWWNYPNII